MQIIIKLPVNNGKFKLQSRGYFKSRQFKSAAGLLGATERSFSLRVLKEKPSIVVKEYIGSHFENINESLSSNDREYLIYCTACFLEDYLCPGRLAVAEKRWIKYLNKPCYPKKQ